MDIQVGNCRTKIGGSSAGHNGIKSIDSNVGRDYMRIRIGIGHPRDCGIPMDAADWVLGRFTSDQLNQIKKTISDIKIL
jgi:PTH1 family peptidyl-tRNA hydrolase